MAKATMTGGLYGIWGKLKAIKIILKKIHIEFKGVVNRISRFQEMVNQG